MPRSDSHGLLRFARMTVAGRRGDSPVIARRAKTDAAIQGLGHWGGLVFVPMARPPGLLRFARNDDFSLRHCEEGEDRRSNPGDRPSERDRAQCPGPAHMDCFALLAMTIFLCVIARRAKTDAACRERSRTAIQRWGHWGGLVFVPMGRPPGLLRVARNDG